MNPTLQPILIHLKQELTDLYGDRLYERVPDAQPWVIRIGHRTVYRFGSRSLKKSV